MTDPVLDALKKTLEREPRNGPLWLHYAQLLEDAGRMDDALAALRTAVELDKQAEPRLIELLRKTGNLAEALIRAERLAEEGADSPELREELERIHEARGTAPEEKREEKRPEDEPVAASAQGDKVDPDDWASQFEWGDLRVTLDDVVGLEDVKRQIHLRIIAPYKQPEIYQAFGREGGGGLLLYGPPGCGKTYIARATAGELGARFLTVSIHDVVDKYWGESEKAVHAIFENARRKSPTVLFFDEFDALGASRGRGESTFWKTLVDQLLQEMDGIEARNRDVLLFAATNAPWNVDSAFRRPGRFDRVLFVPPPDLPARADLLRRHSSKLPGAEGLDVEGLAKKTDVFTGADIKALCERAAERALERSLGSGSVHGVSANDFERALRGSESSALEWLATARNYGRYSNEGGQFDELVAYLKKVKRW